MFTTLRSRASKVGLSANIKAIFYVIQAQVVSLRPMYSSCFYLFFAMVTEICALEAAYAYIATFVSYISS